MRDILASLATGLTSPSNARRRLVVITLVAIVARLVTFGNPVVHVDEEFYWTFARAWLHGAVPYVDIWDRKPIGLFLIYLPAAAFGLPLGIWAYQAMALASLIATAMLIARLADRAGWCKGALAGALAYILWVDFLDGQGGQAPIFYNLLMVAAAALIVPGTEQARHRVRAAVAAMALVGLALQVKYSVVFEGMFFGIWLLWRERKLGPRRAILPLGAGLVLVAILPTVAAWYAFERIGAGPAWAYANVTSIFERKPDPFWEQVGNLVTIVLITSPLIAAALLGRRHGEDGPTAAVTRRWMFGWLGASAFGVLVFGSYFEHYALPFLVPVSICASGFFGRDPSDRWIVLWLLVIAFFGSEALLAVKRFNRGNATQVAEIVETIGHGPGCLYVFSGDSIFYPASGRCTLTRYIFPSHLGRVREEGAIGVDQQAEIERILAARPEIVVFRPPYPGERTGLRAMAEGVMKRDYRLRAISPLGGQQMEIYARVTP